VALGREGDKSSTTELIYGLNSDRTVRNYHPQVKPDNRDRQIVEIKRVLMVDDDQNIRRICQVCLTNVGKWQVILAASGYEGLELARMVLPLC
jgi:hypothetical protein